LEETTVDLLIEEGCCIECASKREYNRMVMHIMTNDAPPGPGDEARLELLREFLEHADFAFLRSSDESLSGTRKARCVLERNGDGVPCVSVHDSREFA
jgi:hypothetical protein